MLVQPWTLIAQSDLLTNFFVSRNKGDYRAMDSIGDMIYKRKDIFDTIPYRTYFFRDLSSSPIHKNNGKWLLRYYNFVNDDYKNIILIGEVNWRLGDFYLYQNELKRAKEFYSIALDFYKKNNDVSYLEKVDFYLALELKNLFDNEALLNNAEALANNDSLLHCRITIQKSLYLYQKEEYLLGDKNMDELLLYLNEFKSDSFYYRYYEFQANLIKASFLLKLNLDIQLQKKYILKNISILNELMDFNFFEYIDILQIVINTLDPIDPMCATLIHDGREYCKRILSNNPYKSLCFGLIEAEYLMSINKLDQAIELCKKQIQFAQNYFFQDLEVKYNYNIIKIYELQGNLPEYVKKSKFLKVEETENGLNVTRIFLSTKELYKLKLKSESEKLEYIYFAIFFLSIENQSKMRLSDAKKIKREVAILIGKDNTYYSRIMREIAFTHLTLNKTKKALRIMLKSYEIDQKNHIESNLKDESKLALIHLLLKNKKYGIVDTMLNSITNNKTTYLNNAFFSFNPHELISQKINFDNFYLFLSSYISFRKLLPKQINIIHNYWVSLNGISNSKGEWLLKELKNYENFELEYHKINSLRKQLNYIDLNNPIICWNNKMINDSLENIQKNIEIDLLKKHLLIPKENKKLDFDYDYFIDISKINNIYNYNTKQWTDSTQYIIFISDSKDTLVDYVFIEDGTKIDQDLFDLYKQEASDPKKKTELTSERFYNYFWKPIADKIGDAKTIYVSLGGVYNNINLNTIYNPSTGKYLIEEKDIRIVNSARDFVLSKESEKKKYTSNTASLFGFPNFDGNNTISADTSNLFASTRDLNSFWLDSLTRGGMKARPLPETKIEVENISSILKSKGWQVNSFLADNASETNIKKQQKPRILHVATHGYFFQDIPVDKDNNRFLGMDMKQVVQDPMLRSGLLLTGANKTLKGEVTSGENGLLTAAEASMLDLKETELVILSACETGRGEVKKSEGVYGLRKAFSDAGAQNIIMSLWKVDDEVTQEFMTLFYEIWLNKKTSIREAFNKTQLEIKAKYPQPYYWGAFILVGE